MEIWNIKALCGGKWLKVISYTDYETAHEAFLSLNAQYGTRVLIVLSRERQAKI